MTTRRKLKKALGELEALGSPGAIAAYLHIHDVKGTPGRAGSCPLAVFLTQQGFKGASVGLTDAWTVGSFSHPSVRLPPTVREFRHQFDRGKFRELDSTRVSLWG